jgi:hypothetical protein
MHCAQFVGGHFAVVVRVRLIKERDLPLVIRLQLGPTDCPITVDIQSTQQPAHHWMAGAMTVSVAMPPGSAVIDWATRLLGVDGAVGPGFGPGLGAGLGAGLG